MSVQAEFISNSGVTNMMELVSKACLKPITSDLLRRITKFQKAANQSIVGTSRGILHVGYRGEELEVPWSISGTTLMWMMCVC
ncbi:hypothetical protein LOAG_09700, partial [Loa loa]